MELRVKTIKQKTGRENKMKTKRKNVLNFKNRLNFLKVVETEYQEVGEE